LPALTTVIAPGIMPAQPDNALIAHTIVIPLEKYDEGHPAPPGRALTNDLCGQDVKVNVNTNVFISALANAVLTLKLTLTF